MAKYYKARRPIQSGDVGEWHQIPAAPLYIVSNDRPQSRLLAESGMIPGYTQNDCIIPVFSQLESDAVFNYVYNRKDQQRARELLTARNRKGVMYSMPLDWVGIALEGLHGGNRRVIIEEHFKRAKALSDKELRELYQVSINAHHSCESCYFCICGIESSFRAARKLSDAELQRHYNTCARNGCECNGYDFTCICGRVIKERQSAEGYAFAADMIYDRR